MNQSPYDKSFAPPSSDWVEKTKQLFTQLNDLNIEPNLSLRRESAIELLCNTLDAEFGFWGWGQGYPNKEETVIPIAMVFHGLTDQERVAFFQMGLKVQVDRWFRHPFLPLLERQTQVCKSRSHFWTDDQWHNSELRAMMIPELGLDEWMICVRYPTPQVWSSVVLFRKTDRPSFGEQDCVMLDLVCSGISWLQSSPASQPKDTDINGLGTRNTEVLLLLLDGRSRKEIASALGVTTHIVNDCMKQIYSHFGTSSATELTALFLKRA